MVILRPIARFEASLGYMVSCLSVMTTMMNASCPCVALGPVFSP